MKQLIDGITNLAGSSNLEVDGKVTTQHLSKRVDNRKLKVRFEEVILL